MFAYTRLAEGLLVAHLFLALAYLIGSNATAWVGRTYRAASPPDAMIRLVCTCALGFAFIGFGAFLIALFGWLTPIFGIGTLCALFFGGCVLIKSSPFRRDYWLERWELVFQAFDIEHVIVYYAMLVVAFPVVNLTMAGADPIAYHWAYAVDWIHAGGLTIDPFLREPFYAHNDLMLVVYVMLLGGGLFVQFVTWMAGLLTALGVCAGVRQAFSQGGIWPSILGVVLAVSAVLSPTYIRWLDSGYLDAMLGFFALASVLALQRAWSKDGGWRWLVVCAILAAFLIGSKTSLLPFIVVFGLVLWSAARRLKCNAQTTAIVLGTLVILSAPWYARNLVLAGDPIPPVINLALYGHDGLDTKSQEKQVAETLATDRTPLSLLTLPLRAFLTPDTLDFREFGENALMLLLYVPTVCVVVAIFILNRRLPPTVTLPVFLLTMMIGYWLFTATIMRYSMLFYPTLALCLALVAGTLTYPLKRSGPILAGVALLTLVITPNAEAPNFYGNFFINGVQNMPAYYNEDEPFLNKFVDGYHEERVAARAMKRLRLSGRIYVIGAPDNYYFRSDGITSIGDGTGPASFFSLFRAIAARKAVAFLDSLSVDAVEFDPLRVIGGFDVPIARQLVAGGYCTVVIPHSEMQLYVRSANDCAQTRRILAR
jgi:hypothetical protein